MLIREIVSFRPVLVGVEQQPAVLVERTEATEWAVVSYRLPPFVPNPTAAEHLVVLGLPFCRRRSVLKRIAHRGTYQWRLLNTIDTLWHLHAAAIEDGGDDIGDVVILVTDLAARFDAFRPRDDERIANAAVVGVSLEHPEGGRERDSPSSRVMSVCVWTPELVE